MLDNAIKFPFKNQIQIAIFEAQMANYNHQQYLQQQQYQQEQQGEITATPVLPEQSNSPH